MKPTRLLAATTTPDGTRLELLAHDHDRIIRVAGQELMSTRQHRSEERLGEVAVAALAGMPRPRVLVGGLGMGFTLRAVLAGLPPGALVTVAELLPAVVAWNRDPALGLAADCLADPRVTVFEGDVGDLLARPRVAFDAVLMDVDNGTDALTVGSNERLYRSAGVGLVRRAIARDGIAVWWSAHQDRAFAALLADSGFAVEVERVVPHARAKQATHVLFIGRPAPSRPSGAAAAPRRTSPGAEARRR